MKTKLLIALCLLFCVTANAQPLDTLKIKTEADNLKTVADSLRKAYQLEEAFVNWEKTKNRLE